MVAWHGGLFNAVSDLVRHPYYLVLFLYAFLNIACSKVYCNARYDLVEWFE